MSIRTEHSSLRQGLVGAWCPSLQAGGVTVPDLSWRGAQGRLTSASYSASGSGLSFQSVSGNKLAASPLATFGSSASLSLWVQKTNASSGEEAWLCEASANASFQTHYAFSDGNCYIRTFRNARVQFSPLASVDRTQWHNVCITTDGTTWRFYQAGILAASNAAEASVAFSSSAFEIARSVSARWDDIRLYNRALTPAEIRLLASRRGIGLSPLPDRAAGLPRRFSVNVGGTWREADSYVNVGGVWRLGQPSVNVGGTWK